MFLTSSETLKASLDEFPQNGDFSSNCNLFGVKPFHLSFWERLRRAVCPKWTPNQIRVGRFQGKCFLFECIPTKFQSLRGRLDKWSTTYAINLWVVCFCSRWLLFLPNSGSSLWFRSDQVPFFFWKVGWLRRIFLFYLLCSLPLLKRSMRLWITYLKTETFSQIVFFLLGLGRRLCVLWKGAEVSSSSFLNAKSDKGESLAKTMLIVWIST